MRRSPEELERERARWRSAVRRRPERIEVPGPGQESVWDYPRPPRLTPEARLVRVEFAGIALAESTRALRVLETGGPPVYYLPAVDVRTEHLEPTDESSLCEWKGIAHYWSLRVADRFAENAAWSYPDPDPDYRALREHFAFFAGRVDACSVGGRPVAPQPGDYYGGWVTSGVVGPFKGGPGSEDW